MICPNCSFETEDNFCPKCGTAMNPSPQPVGAATSTGVNQQSQPQYQQPQMQPPYQQPTIIINNANTNTNTNTAAAIPARALNKWVALALCFFLGLFGAHKFYEGKTGMGVLYLLTGGLFFIGVIIDFISILFKPTTYYVYR